MLRNKSVFAILITLSTMIAVYGQANYTNNNRGNLVRIGFNQKEINLKDTLGIWHYNWNSSSFFDYATYYSHITTPQKSYFLKMQEFLSESEVITNYVGKRLVENEVTLNQRQFGTGTGPFWDILTPYMINNTIVEKTPNGNWLISGDFGNGFLINSDSLKVFDINAPIGPNTTMAERMRAILGKVGSKYLAAFHQQDGSYDYLLVELDNSPNIDTLKSIKALFTKSSYDGNNYAITEVRNISGDLYAISKSHGIGLDIYKFSDSTFYYIKTVLKDNFSSDLRTGELWECRNGKLYQIRQGNLVSYEFSSADTSFINRKVLLDGLTNNYFNNLDANFGIDKNFKYAAKIFRKENGQDTLKILDLDKMEFINSLYLGGVKKAFMPIIDSPYVYVHQITDQHTGIEDGRNSTILTDYSLSAYPNPFNASVKISYTLPYDSNVELSIYDMLGRKLTTLVKGLEKKGSHEVIFNASNFPSGIYLYTIYSGSYKKTNKLMLLK